MARIPLSQMDSYGGTGNQMNYFSLANDKDTAQVRFCYDNMSEIEEKSILSIHQIELNGKQRDVNCLRESYNSPLSDCPLCEAKIRTLSRMYLFVYDLADEQIKIWTRGRTFSGKISSLCSRFSPLKDTVFEIERNGKKGDTSTTYEIFQVKTDSEAWKYGEELPELLGGLVLDKTYEEMEYYLQTGDFRQEENVTRRETKTQNTGQNEEPVRRRRI